MFVDSGLSIDVGFRVFYHPNIGLRVHGKMTDVFLVDLEGPC